MAEAVGRVGVGLEEITLLREGYQQHRNNFVRILAHIRQNICRLPERVRELYRRRTATQLRRRIREVIGREIAE